jgi:hypothetical protein
VCEDWDQEGKNEKQRLHEKDVAVGALSDEEDLSVFASAYFFPSTSRK